MHKMKLLQKAAVLMVALWMLAVAPVSEASWRLDEDPNLTEPRNFRMTSGGWLVEPEGEPPSREGLDALRVSGSAQPNAAIFATLYATLSAAAPGAPIYDVDLRQESHGFADGMPVSWHKDHNLANEGKTPAEVEADETARLSALPGVVTTFAPKGKTDKNRFSAVTFPPEKVETEKETAEAAGFRYQRFYVTDRYAPDTETIEAFLDFAESLPKDAWLHFHCHAGHGRTTTFMALYDILRNPDVPVDEIIERQHLIGGADLTAQKKEEWRNVEISKRLELIKDFSRYIQEKRAGQTALRWSEWIEAEDGEEAEAA